MVLLATVQLLDVYKRTAQKQSLMAESLMVTWDEPVISMA